MFEAYDVSVVISTYNRSDMLPGALDSVLEQESEGARYEVIVVDNNSTDGTKEIIENYIKRGHLNLRYLFEERQGVAYARNTGLTDARALIIAFTDDDVRVARDWIANIKKEFASHPEVYFVGGKILPKWPASPPAWLTQDHWWPLALLDYGDQPFYVSADKPLCLPTANCAFRRELFERFGVFSPQFSGREDHEFLLRLWSEGVRGMYAPNIMVTAQVQPERLKKAYHRRWNKTTGKFNSLMRLNENMGPDGRIVGEPPDEVTMFGVPAFVYRSLLTGVLGLVGSILHGRRAASLRYKNYIWYLIGYIGKRYEQNASIRGHSGLREIVAFAKALVRKKWNARKRQSTTQKFAVDEVTREHSEI
jgi:glycosyltransferase involved in cell wall biosynthesis